MSLDPVALLQSMLEVPSPSGQEGELAAMLVEAMDRAGFRAFVDEAGNALGLRGRGPRLGLLLGHMDTVPGSIPVRLEGGRLYGRGAVDAKGPLAAFVAAASAVEVPPDWTLAVVGAVEEEAPTSRGARHAARTYRPEWALVGEPSGWERMALGYRGRLQLRFTVRAPQFHTAAPLPRAVETAVELWGRLRQVHSGTSFSDLQVQLRALTSGDDGLDQWATAEVTWRLPPGRDPEELEAELRPLLDGHQAEFFGHEPPFLAPKNTLIVRALLSAIREAGGRPRFALKTGTSDMNVVGPAWDCPIATYGPGDSTLDHTPQEHIDVEELHRATQVLERALAALLP